MKRKQRRNTQCVHSERRKGENYR